MQRLKLRTWARVIISMILFLIGLIFYSNNCFNNQNIQLLYWLIYVPFMAGSLLFLWEFKDE